MKFRKKPVEVMAYQWRGDTETDVVELPKKWRCKHCGGYAENHGHIKTLEGGHIVCREDWIITGVQGEKYPCKPDIFKMTYEEVR